MGKMFDLLADAVDDINSIFSIQVTKIVFQMVVSSNFYSQMVPVFFFSFLSEIFFIYYILKVLTLKSSINLIEMIDFLMWNLELLFSSLFAIVISSKTLNEIEKLKARVGKYSNCCKNEIVGKKVQLRFFM